LSIESRTQYTLNWKTNGTTCATGGLLHFALTHQLESMGKGAATPAASQNGTRAGGSIVVQSTTRGAMTGVVTKAAGGVAPWKMTEPELKQEIGFYAPRKIEASLVTSLKLKETLQADINAEWVLDGASYYFTGKAYQKYASLCLMADDPAVMGEDKTLMQTCVKKLETLLDKFLTNSFPSPLIYESTYRGLTTSEGITKNDVNADFGNGIYNDHHYHYGYWICASAMLRKLDPKWARMAELEVMVTTMMRDVANPSPEDTHFPTFRHFSWYLGHSVSHGATPMNDGKDQESTSEDMNFFYGMMLWGKVTSNKAVEDLGSLMLRIDAHAIRTYFLMESSNKVHPPEFAKNHVTGIFFDGKVDYATWFSAEKYCIHGIQMIPVSPVNEIIRSPKFVKEEWDDVLSKEAIVVNKDMTNAWNSLLYANYAVINKPVALEVLSKVKMDDGLTRSWALYVAATRPDGVAAL
jgi:endo-1,3(4)-beta-glucanase